MSWNVPKFSEKWRERATEIFNEWFDVREGKEWNPDPWIRGSFGMAPYKRPIHEAMEKINLLENMLNFWKEYATEELSDNWFYQELIGTIKGSEEVYFKHNAWMWVVVLHSICRVASKIGEPFSLTFKDEINLVLYAIDSNGKSVLVGKGNA